MLKKMVLLFIFLLVAQPARAALNINPATQEELVKILQGLADDHAYRQWCDKQCSQIYSIKVSGEIAKGELNIEIRGNVLGENNAVVPLFGTMPPVQIKALKNGNDTVALLHHNKSFHTFLSPGPFHLVGTIGIDPGVSTNIIMPGAVGKVDLDIIDQEPLLKKVAMGQTSGSFQIVAASKSKDSGGSKRQGGLRLNVLRDFRIARDKTFRYQIDVIGAQTGQVIFIPLTHGEKVLLTNPSTAKTKTDGVDFTATGVENHFVIEGEWTKPDVVITAAGGAIQETWSVACEGAYDCSFDGEVEKALGGVGHQWIPQSGQTLSVNWKELGMLKGQSIVAQEVLLDTVQQGKGLKQTLTMSLTSSAADQVFLNLPRGAAPIKLSYGGDNATVLENDKKSIHLTIPQGTSQVQLTWALNQHTGWSLPMPVLNLPIGRWVFWFSPNEKQNAIFAGGPGGSPVVLFWPRLVFCLFVAFLFLFAEKKLIKQQHKHTVLFYIFCAGFALIKPDHLLVALAYLMAIRLLLLVKMQRTIFGWIFEGGIVLLLLVATGEGFMIILDRSFFSSEPFLWDNFCSSSSLLGVSRPHAALCWETSHLMVGQAFKAPYALTVPTLAVRVAYFFWALVAGFYFYCELKNLWTSVKYYFGLGLRSVLKRQAKIGP